MQFLGKQIIDYYEDKLGVNLGISDLIEFTDIISANPKFIREDFDNYIVSILTRLAPTDTQKQIAGANCMGISPKLFTYSAFNLTSVLVKYTTGCKKRLTK